jgi:hypothetical protein
LTSSVPPTHRTLLSFSIYFHLATLCLQLSCCWSRDSTMQIFATVSFNSNLGDQVETEGLVTGGSFRLQLDFKPTFRFSKCWINKQVVIAFSRSIIQTVWYPSPSFILKAHNFSRVFLLSGFNFPSVCSHSHGFAGLHPPDFFSSAC